MISVSGLTKKYGELVAVNNISFTIRKGEITGLLGPNGAGKTTTLRMLTCYLEPTAGRISVGGAMVDESPLEVKRMVGYLPEAAPLYGEMMVYDYLAYVGSIRNIPRADLTGRIREIADICGLNEVMHQNVSELSRGYKQRVGLAHAMIHDPEILILDEPTTGLDPNQIVEIRNLIKKIGKMKTVILSTHILPEVEATCDRVIIIDRGNIVADGSTAEIKSAHGGEAVVSLAVSGAGFDELSAALRSIAGVKDLVRKDGEEGLASVSIIASERADLRPDLFRLVSQKGWVIYEMKREHRTLESVFRELTKGGGHEE